jgi:hypothetical protein
MRTIVRVIPVFLIGVMLAERANATTIAVSAISNIFAADETAIAGFDPGGGGPGSLPPSFAFGAGAGQSIVFSSVTGSVSCCSGGATFNGPDGGLFASGTTDINSFSGISGILHGGATMFLVGVFTDGTDFDGAAPSRLNFTGATSFASLSPLLHQTFFIGDGLTGTGSGAFQTFNVPSTATRLYLGFADALEFGNPTSDPGFYGDNVGSLNATFDLRTTAVPEPSTLALVALGTIRLIRRVRRRV